MLPNMFNVKTKKNMEIQKYQKGRNLVRLGGGLLDAAEFIPVAGDILGMGRSLLRRD